MHKQNYHVLKSMFPKGTRTEIQSLDGNFFLDISPLFCIPNEKTIAPWFMKIYIFFIATKGSKWLQVRHRERERERERETKTERIRLVEVSYH